MDKKPDIEILKIEETKTAVCKMGADGILRHYTKKNAIETLEDAKLNVTIGRKLLEYKKGAIMVNLSESKGLSMEARKYYSSKEVAEHIYAFALVVNSPISKVIGNFMLGIYQSPSPTKLFITEDDAIKWLKTNFC